MPIIGLKRRPKSAAIVPLKATKQPDPFDAARAELAEINAAVAALTAEVDRLGQPAPGLDMARQAVADAQAKIGAVRAAEAADGERWAQDGGAMPKPRHAQRNAAEDALAHAQTLLSGAEAADARRQDALVGKIRELNTAQEAQRQALGRIVRGELYEVARGELEAAALEINRRWAAIHAINSVLMGELNRTSGAIFGNAAMVPTVIDVPLNGVTPDTAPLIREAANDLQRTLAALRELLPEPPDAA